MASVLRSGSAGRLLFSAQLGTLEGLSSLSSRNKPRTGHAALLHVTVLAFQTCTFKVW